MMKKAIAQTRQQKAQKVLELHNVHKSFKLEGAPDVPVLKGVSFSVKLGELTAISGASGSGKSTLLNLIGCLDVPTSGKVFVNGVDTSVLSDDELAHVRGREIGFIFQSFNLQPNLTAFENVALPMRIHEFPEDEIAPAVDKLLALVGLEHRQGHYPNQLSGGQQQRVAIARALSTRPAIVLADEPTGNLDSTAGTAVLDLLSGINTAQKVTVLIVTHEPRVFAYARRIIHVQDGLVKRISEEKNP